MENCRFNSALDTSMRWILPSRIQKNPTLQVTCSILIKTTISIFITVKIEDIGYLYWFQRWSHKSTATFSAKKPCPQWTLSSHWCYNSLGPVILRIKKIFDSNSHCFNPTQHANLSRIASMEYVVIADMYNTNLLFRQQEEAHYSRKCFQQVEKWCWWTSAHSELRITGVGASNTANLHLIGLVLLCLEVIVTLNNADINRSRIRRSKCLMQWK